jgi:hypothetical protein
MSVRQEIERFKFQGRSIPEHMQYGIVGYLDHRIVPGDFLFNLLCNDLKGTVERADATNLWLIPVYVAFLYNHADSRSWGSKEKVGLWIDTNGYTNDSSSTSAKEEHHAKQEQERSGQDE